MGTMVKSLIILTMLSVCGVAVGQDAPARVPATLGVVTKIDAGANVITIKTDAGAEIAVNIQPKASFRHIEPGEQDLSKATLITLPDIKNGDRVLARGKLSDDQKSVAATLVVVISSGDIAKKQAEERADWDKRGVTGLVTAAAADQITITVRGMDGSARPMTITPKANAIVRRYAADSVKFADAKASTIPEIKVGDQVRARGDKTPDGMKMTADEIVSGSFHNLAGLILSIDAQKNEVRINNIETKKPVTVKIEPDSTVKKLNTQMATVIANRLHGTDTAGAANGDTGRGGGAGAGGGQGGGRGAGGPGGVGTDGARAGGFGGGRGGGRGGDLQQLLEQTPKITLADLKAGDAIIVSTVGASADQVTAISLLAGVEPILTKPGTREMSLGDWNMGGGGGIE